MDKECPSLLILDEFTSYNFQCYSDLVDPIIKWKVNGIGTLRGVEVKLFQVNTTKEQIDTAGSVLSIFIRRNHDNITCMLGNNSKLVYIHGKFNTKLKNCFKLSIRTMDKPFHGLKFVHHRM